MPAKRLLRAMAIHAANFGDSRMFDVLYWLLNIFVHLPALT